ncbi:MAG: hypothetical protein HDP34_03465 [Clostridia bacterium]|nr:hypothetical protein [Clostridia bacterium]
MKTAKEIATISVFTALLIGAQFVLSGISGVEIVTVLLLTFCYYFGAVRGVLVASAFSLLRCFIFGFFPTVIILYLIYYNLFAAVFGLLGLKLKRQSGLKQHTILIFAAIIMTALFTGLDDIITPLYYGFTRSAAKAYALASLTALVPQTVCAIVTVGALFLPLSNIFSRFAEKL